MLKIKVVLNVQNTNKNSDLNHQQQDKFLR